MGARMLTWSRGRRRSALVAATAVTVSLLSGVVVVAPASAAVCPVKQIGGSVLPAPSTGLDWSGCDLSGTVLPSSDFTGVNLTGANLAGAYLADSTWDGAVLAGADLTGATLQGARSTGLVPIVGTPTALPAPWTLAHGVLIGNEAIVRDVDLTGTVLTAGDLEFATLSSVNLTDVDLTGVALTGAVLTTVDLTRTVLAGATLTGVRGTRIAGAPASAPTGWDVQRGYLVGPTADLTGARLDGVDLHSRDLSLADLSLSSLVGTNLSNANLSTASLAGANLARATISGADLGGAALDFVRSGFLVGSPAPVLPAGRSVVKGYLAGPFADLDYADLGGASLAGADLHGASLRGAYLGAAALSGANLTGTSLYLARLPKANLSNADLSDAELDNTDLGGANLRSANLTGTVISYGYWVGTDLTGAIGLGSGAVTTTGIDWTTTICPDGRVGLVHDANSCLNARDTLAPTASLRATPEFWVPSGIRSMTLVADAADGGSGLYGSRVRWRSAPAGTTAWSAWSTGPFWGGGTVRQDITVVRGRRYCFSAQSLDNARNASSWTAERCTTVPLDDQQLTASPGWTRDPSAAGSFWTSWTQTSTRGASLTTATSLSIKRLGVVALTCATCGSIAVYVGSAQVASYSLASATSVSRRLLLLPAFATARVGKVRVVVTSAAGRLVRIDGLAVSAY